jgi:hypothetical protein
MWHRSTAFVTRPYPKGGREDLGGVLRIASGVVVTGLQPIRSTSDDPVGAEARKSGEEIGYARCPMELAAILPGLLAFVWRGLGSGVLDDWALGARPRAPARRRLLGRATLGTSRFDWSCVSHDACQRIPHPMCAGHPSVTKLPPNKRLKLPARVEYCMTAFSPARRSLSAPR